MNNKGFTLVELLAVIVVIGILSALAVVSYNSLIESGKKGLYKNYENTLKGGAQNYFIDNTGDIPAVGETIVLSYQTLLDKKYIEEFNDPNGGNCITSYVEVLRGNDIGSNYNLTYKACLICKDGSNSHYVSKDCSNEIQSNGTVIITFNANGGEVSPASKEIDKNATTYGYLPTPISPAGYIFAGWYTESEGGIKVEESTPFSYNVSTTTLYAHYSKGVELPSTGGTYMIDSYPDSIRVRFSTDFVTKFKDFDVEANLFHIGSPCSSCSGGWNIDYDYQDLPILNSSMDYSKELINIRINERNLSPMMTRKFNSSGVAEFKNIEIGIYFINFSSDSEEILATGYLVPILLTNTGLNH